MAWDMRVLIRIYVGIASQNHYTHEAHLRWSSNTSTGITSPRGLHGDSQSSLVPVCGSELTTVFSADDKNAMQKSADKLHYKVPKIAS